jgi:hypothetical protein
MSESSIVLEKRLALIEDKLAIYNLIASHPLSADTGYGPFFPKLYTEDATFDRGANVHGAAGRDQLIALVESDAHKSAIAGGMAHFGNLPYVQIDGDVAQVTSYIMIVTFNGDAAPRELANHGLSNGHNIFRLVANRWTVVRTAEGWRVKIRRVFPMDGSKPAQELLHDAVTA